MKESFPIKSSPTVRITPAILKRLATYEMAAGQRPLSPVRVGKLLAALERGQFKPPDIEYVYCEETKTHIIVNGQHSKDLATQVLSRNEAEECFQVCMKEYEPLATLADVSRLYNTCDQNTMVRTAADAVASVKCSIPAIEDVHGRLVGSCVAGIWFWEKGKSYAQHATSSERAEILRDQITQDFVLWACKITDNRSTNSLHMIKVGVMAAMFATWSLTKREASTFWCCVRDGTGKAKDPVAWLYRYLLTVVVTGNMIPTSGKLHPSGDARAICVKSIHAWNAWRTNTNTDGKYHPGAPMPELK